MAKCQFCGEPAGWLSSICTYCEIKEAEQRAIKERLDEETARAATVKRAGERMQQLKEEQEQREQYAENQRKLVQERRQILSDRISRGERIFRYTSIYVPVDSLLMGDPINPSFNIDPLKELGFAGWEIIQVIPRTAGIALENKYMVSPSQGTYGGGIGGNVVGVHVLLKKEILLATIEEDTWKELDSYLESLA